MCEREIERERCHKGQQAYRVRTKCSEHDLQKQLNQALDQLTDLRQSHDDTQAQLISHDQTYGKLTTCSVVSIKVLTEKHVL